MVKGEAFDGWGYETERFDPRKPQVAKRNPKGRLGITTYGAKLVRSACYSLQKNYGRRRLGMTTGTLPSNPEYLCLWVERWAEITRKFLQEFKRELARVGAPTEIIGVTEIQTKRSDEVEFCIPHFHFVYVCWDGQKYMTYDTDKGKKRKPEHYISHSKAKEIWDRVLANEIALVLEIPAETVDVSGRIELKTVRKSAEGYLGKYMSKGAKDVKKYLDADRIRTDIPSHWWHCTKELRDIVKGLVTEVAPAMVELITSNFTELIDSGLVQYLRAITKDINGVERILGYAGKWKPAFNPIKPSDIELAFGTS